MPKTAISIRIETALLEELRTWISEQRPRPTMTSTLEAAVDAWLDANQPEDEEAE
jgi:hypothetical protein